MKKKNQKKEKKGPTHRVSSSSFCHRQGFMAAGNTALLNFVFLVSFLAAYKAKAGTSEKKALASPLLMLRRAVPCRAVLTPSWQRQQARLPLSQGFK